MNKSYRFLVCALGSVLFSLIVHFMQVSFTYSMFTFYVYTTTFVNNFGDTLP